MKIHSNFFLSYTCVTKKSEDNDVKFERLTIYTKFLKIRLIKMRLFMIR